MGKEKTIKCVICEETVTVKNSKDTVCATCGEKAKLYHALFDKPHVRGIVRGANHG